MDREPHMINSLSLAALFILGYNPLQIFDIGFQLSFVSVLGIVLLSPRIINLFKVNPVRNYRATSKEKEVSNGVYLIRVAFGIRNYGFCPGGVAAAFYYLYFLK